MNEVQPIREFDKLTPEQIQAQNQEAFEYLRGLLGNEEHKVVHQEPKIELSKRGEGKVIEVAIKPTERRSVVAPPDVFEEEAYLISAEKGLVTVDLSGEAYLASGLTYFMNIHAEVGPGGNRYEHFFLPAGRNSVKTAAKLIADGIKDRVERSEK